MPQRGVTISLAAEAQSVTKCSKAPDSYNANVDYDVIDEITGGGDLDPFITKTDNFSTGSIAVAAFGGCIFAYAGISMKVRLFMGGVQVAESVNVSMGTEGFTTVMGSKALVGSQVVKVIIHNYGATNNFFWKSDANDTSIMYPLLIVGSVKP